MADPQQVWPRIIAYEQVSYGTMDHPEIQFSVQELETPNKPFVSDVSLFAEPCFIRRHAAVSIVDDVDPSGFDEVIARKRVQSAGGTVSSQAIFNQCPLHVAIAASAPATAPAASVQPAPDTASARPALGLKSVPAQANGTGAKIASVTDGGLVASAEWPSTNVVLLKIIKRQAPCAYPNSSGYFMRYNDIEEAETSDTSKFYERGTVDQRRTMHGKNQLKGRNSDTGRVFEFQSSDNFCHEDFFDQLKSTLEEYRIV